MGKKIGVPSFLDEKLKGAKYEYVVRQALQDFGDWFNESKTPFFPDYTDHGITHIEEVLSTAEGLIPDKSRQYFTSADATALILAVLFHDSALHLSEAGFFELIQGQYKGQCLNTYDSLNWQRTWEEFIFYARRWDDTKLIDVFGKNKYDGPNAQVRDPFNNWDSLTKYEYRLIGEFIRQHHPRLGHEMAVFGVPGYHGTALKLNDNLPLPWRDLVGLIARSHGMPIRTCIDYLSNNTTLWGANAKFEYQNVHSVYLMALLRISDYVQIQASRTSERIFEYKKIPSRISVLEHQAHQAITNITNNTHDPESLSIDAHPQEVSIFLRLKEWLAGIQNELDASWSVLGEVYGRIKGLQDFGLTFRRVRSNLDDVTTFSKSVHYVPGLIKFDVAKAELLQLLIGPLYGDDPTFGVRELMQNSIDAVLEYEQFVQDHPNYKNISRREQETDVTIELSPIDKSGYANMTISDRGIGMRVEVIQNYFLRAGASYRKSNQWKTDFEFDKAEIKTSKVLRSGRFGVGALAAFLIGDQIEVETRHITAEEGYNFKTTLNADLIEIFRNNTLHVGTCIKIRVNEHIYIRLLTNSLRKNRPNFWDWYHFDKPAVLRKFIDLESKVHNALSKQILDLYSGVSKWRKLSNEFPYDVFWTFENAPALTCNGIFISMNHILEQ